MDCHLFQVALLINVRLDLALVIVFFISRFNCVETYPLAASITINDQCTPELEKVVEKIWRFDSERKLI